MLSNRRLATLLTQLPEPLAGAVSSSEALTALAGLQRLVCLEPTVFQGGAPAVSRYFAIQDQTLATKQHVLQIAGSLARGNPEPEMQALVRSVKEADLPLRELEIEQDDGVMIGRLERRWYLLGDEHALHAQGVELGVTSQTLASQIEDEGCRILFLADQQHKKLLAIFAIATPLQMKAEATVRALEGLGIELILLTERKTRIAKGIGQTLGIPLVHSELSPAEKARIILSLQENNKAVGVLCDAAGFLQVPESSFSLLLGRRAVSSAGVLVPELGQLPEMIALARQALSPPIRKFFWQRA